MLEGISVDQRVEFVSEHDKTEPKTVFVFKPLSGLEMIGVSSSGTLDLRKFILESTVEIKGVEDKAKMIDSLSMQVIGEIINKLNALNGISEQERKNS